MISTPALLRTRRFTVASGLAVSVGLSLAAVLLASSARAQTIENTEFIAPQLYELVYNPTRGVLYVASATNEENGGGKVLGLDPETLAVVETIDTGAEEPYGIALNNATQILYTTNTRDGSIHAIDLATGTIVATIEAPEGADHVREAVVDEAANRIYVTTVGGGDGGDILIIDGETNTIAATIIGIGAATGLVLDAEHGRLYTTVLDQAEVAVIDTAAGGLIARFSSWGAQPTNVEVDPETQRLFVTNQGTSNVTVLDATSGDLLATIPTGAGALGVRLDPEADRLYVANRGAGTVTVVDSETYAVVADLATGTYPNTVAIDYETHTAYVTNKAQGAERGGPAPDDPNGNTVSIIRP